MNSTMVEEASKVIPNIPVLINVISRRVRQLHASARPVVEVTPGMDATEIALAEIIAGKLKVRIPGIDEKAA